MGCCGQKRAAFSTGDQPAPRDEARRQVGRQAPGPVKLRYMGDRPVHVRGTVTGRTYVFASPGAVAEIDPRDRPGLVRTGKFATTP
jgi:hypothetical protein